MPVLQSKRPSARPPGPPGRTVQAASEFNLHPALPAATLANNQAWIKLVEEGKKAGAGHDKQTASDDLAAHIKFKLGDTSQTTYAVALSVKHSHVIIARQNYQATSADTNAKMLSAAQAWAEGRKLEIQSMEVCACSGASLHAEMGIAKYMRGKIADYSFGASIGCCPLCMAYLQEQGASFGKAGGTPLTGWQHPDGTTLAHP